MIQKVNDMNKRPCLLFLDIDAQVSLITNQKAEEAGYKGQSASIQIMALSPGGKKKSQIQDRVLLCWGWISSHTDHMGIIE
jgi:hypothetical protein